MLQNIHSVVLMVCLKQSDPSSLPVKHRLMPQVNSTMWYPFFCPFCGIVGIALMLCIHPFWSFFVYASVVLHLAVEGCMVAQHVSHCCSFQWVVLLIHQCPMFLCPMLVVQIVYIGCMCSLCRSWHKTRTCIGSISDFVCTWYYCLSWLFRSTPTIFAEYEATEGWHWNSARVPFFSRINVLPTIPGCSFVELTVTTLFSNQAVTIQQKSLAMVCRDLQSLTKIYLAWLAKT